MSLTYGGTDVQGVTYNGTDVQEITYNGVTVWEAVKPNLEDNDWSKIIKICESGRAANYWNVGDSKPITLTFSETFTVFKGLSGTYRAVILGFNHNAALEGNTRTHFMIGKNEDGTKDIAFEGIGYDGQTRDSYFTIDLPADSSSSAIRGRQWTDSTLYWGWLNSTSSYSASNNGFKNAMPETLRNALKTVTKYGYYFVSANNGYTSHHTSTIDLPSEKEIFGSSNISAKEEADNCQQYDYFKNIASKVRYSHKDNSNPVNWWTRSPNPTNSVDGTRANYCYVKWTGEAASQNAIFGYAITPIFYL